MRDADSVMTALKASPFRMRFTLDDADRKYLHERGVDAVCEHAGQFIEERLGDAMPPNDGKQTPMRGHPAFVAQHATATCCRGCLAKWHGVPAGRALTSAEVAHCVAVIRRWLREREPDAPVRPLTLFDG